MIHFAEKTETLADGWHEILEMAFAINWRLAIALEKRSSWPSLKYRNLQKLGDELGLLKQLINFYHSKFDKQRRLLTVAVLVTWSVAIWFSAGKRGHGNTAVPIERPSVTARDMFWFSNRNCKQTTMSGLTWEEFLDDINDIMRLSRKLNDNWELVRKVSLTMGWRKVAERIVLVAELRCVRNIFDEEAEDVSPGAWSTLCRRRRGRCLSMLRGGSWSGKERWWPAAAGINDIRISHFLSSELRRALSVFQRSQMR